MARKKKDGNEPSLTIAIVGDGVSPATIPARQLAALLEASSSMFEAIAKQDGFHTPTLMLTKVSKGSAAYSLTIQGVQAPQLARAFLRTAKSRGKDSSDEVRRNLTKMHALGAKNGSGLRVDPPKGKSVHIAPPISETTITLEEVTIVAARVVGVMLSARENMVVTLQYADGGRGEFIADQEMLDLAAGLMRKDVYATVTFNRSGNTEKSEGELEKLELRAGEVSIIKIMQTVRDEMDRDGIVFSSEQWLRENSDDE